MERLVNDASKEGQALRYGYPAVLVEVPGSQREDRWRIAPLLAVDCEVERSADGLALRATADPCLNRELLSSRVGPIALRAGRGSRSG